MTSDEQIIDGFMLSFLLLGARVLCSLLWNLVRLCDVYPYDSSGSVPASELRQVSRLSTRTLTRT